MFGNLGKANGLTYPKLQAVFQSFYANLKAKQLKYVYKECIYFSIKILLAESWGLILSPRYVSEFFLLLVITTERSFTLSDNSLWNSWNRYLGEEKQMCRKYYCIELKSRYSSLPYSNLYKLKSFTMLLHLFCS